jgi:hypothetical protein
MLQDKNKSCHLFLVTNLMEFAKSLRKTYGKQRNGFAFTEGFFDCLKSLRSSKGKTFIKQEMKNELSSKWTDIVFSVLYLVYDFCLISGSLSKQN